MPTIDRRTLLYVLGGTAIFPIVASSETGGRRVAVSNAGESRFRYKNSQQARLSPCKLTSDDTDGRLSTFELIVPSRSGPVRHVHHREDEWCYVAAGRFSFEVGDSKYDLPVGGSIWMPRDIPHVWANTSRGEGKLIVACQPGGFEKFFDEIALAPVGDPAQIKAVMARYGMEYLGPPLLGPWRKQ